jgi:transcriptional antiterminator Rof (Rho-off)
MDMTRRRLMAPVVAIAAASVCFALAGSASALPGAVINQLFGARMIRAEVLVLAPDGSPQDYRIDRGTVTALTSAQITLREANGDVVPIQLATGVQVQGAGRLGLLARLRRNLRVTVYRLANAPANLVEVEGRAAVAQTLLTQLSGGGMVRAEVLVVAPDGSTQDYRIDRGTVAAATAALITLREANGDVVPIQLAAGAQVQGRLANLLRLRRSVGVSVLRLANAPAGVVQVESVGP